MQEALLQGVSKAAVPQKSNLKEDGLNKDFPAQLLKKARSGGRGRGKKRQNLVRKHRNAVVQFNGLKAPHVWASRIFPSLSSELCQDSQQWLQWDKAISGFRAASFNTDVTANSFLHGNLHRAALGTMVSFPTPCTGLCKPSINTHRQTRCFPASKEMEAELTFPLVPFLQVPHFHVLSPFHLKDRERRGSSGSGLHTDRRKATRNTASNKQRGAGRTACGAAEPAQLPSAPRGGFASSPLRSHAGAATAG